MGRIEEDVTVRATEGEAAANLLAMLRLCAAGKLRCGEKTQRPSAATVKAVAEVLADGDFYPGEPIAAFAWPLLLLAGGLAESGGGRLQLTARGRAAMAKPSAGTIRDLWRRWVSSGPIDEFSRIEAIKGQRGANVLTALKPRRRNVAHALAGCEAGEWVAVEVLFRQMRQNGLSPTIARSERGLWKLYIEDPQYGSLGYDGYHNWNMLEGRYTLAVLFEYAATLGLVDVEYVHPGGARDDYHAQWGGDHLDRLSRYDGLVAVRLNALGAYVLGQASGYLPPAPAEAPARPLKVLPNHDIVVTGELALSGRLVLDAFSRHTSDRVWTLSAASLLAAIESGRDLKEFKEFLDGHADGELPGTVVRLLTDTQTRAGHVRDHGLARLIECVDVATAVLISGDRKAGRFCQRVGERHLAVPLDNEDGFRKSLRTLGYVLPLFR
jgi:pentatricopeptide repeat protein